MTLNALYNKYYDLRDRTMSPTKEMGIVKEHINKLRKELEKLDKKINKVRRSGKKTNKNGAGRMATIKEMLALRWEMEDKLDSAFTEFNRLWDSLNAENDVTKELKAVKPAIDDLWLKLEQLDDKINETRSMRESK